MFIGNIEVLFKSKYGVGPDMIAYINSYPEENPTQHVYEARSVDSLHFFLVEQNPDRLIIRELEEDEKKNLKLVATAPPDTVTTL